MYHNFLASQWDQTKCARCKHSIDEHYCEVCDNKTKQVDVRYGTMLLCEDCWAKEQALQSANNTPEKQQQRVNDMNILVENARNIDDKLKLSTDIFNAKTVAIVDVLKAIEDNPAIENKPYAKAEWLSERFNKMKMVIFEANKVIIDSTNEQKVLQVQLNQIANKLRSEEREKLRISDINYQPTIKPVKVSTVRNVTKKFDKDVIRKAALETGFSEFIIQTLIVQKNWSVEQVVNHLRRSVAEAKSESVTPVTTNEVK